MMDFKKESTQGTVKPNLLEVQLGQSGGGMSFGTKINNGLKKITSSKLKGLKRRLKLMQENLLRLWLKQNIMVIYLHQEELPKMIFHKL